MLHKQPGSQILKPGQKVYLYGDRRYEGKLIRPLEKTYPPKWTVQLKIGGHVAANVTEISPLESHCSKPKKLEIPFSEDPETEKIAQLEQKIILSDYHDTEIPKSNNRIS